MRISCSTSARCGTFSSVNVSSVSIEAIISGSAAFLAPEIGIVPESLLPPTILIRSIFLLFSGKARSGNGFDFARPSRRWADGVQETATFWTLRDVLRQAPFDKLPLRQAQG